jgi:hypothetical protein
VPCGAVATFATTFSEPVAPLGVVVIGYTVGGMSLKVAVRATGFPGIVKVAVSPLALIVAGVIVTPAALRATRRPAPREAVNVIVVPCAASEHFTKIPSEPVAPIGFSVIEKTNRTLPDTTTALAGIVKVAVPLLVLIVDGVITTPSALRNPASSTERCG